MPDPVARLQSALADRYVFERELGRGGMATVYLTSDLRHHRKVAVKVLRPELVAAVSRERFQREISIVAHLTHPHILPLYDSGVVDDTCFFVMPYVKGETLRARIDREGQLPIEEALRIACEIADALAYAHSQNIVHRDIKPQNIMLESGHAVVADFGIAMVTDDIPAARLTQTGFSLGTPHYMSPEQGSAARRIDSRTDIYSLGCVLYEMLAGTPPFNGANVYAIMARHAAEAPPSIRVVRQTVSEFLEQVTFQALAKSPADRYRTAGEFMQALTEVTHERVRDAAPGRTTAPRPVEVLDVERSPSGSNTATYDQTTKTRLTAYVAAAAGVLLLPAAVGFVSTTVYDLKLGVPYLYTPTRVDFPIIGMRALIPMIFVALVLLVAYVLAKQFIRLFVDIAGRSPVMKGHFDGLRRRGALWRAFWSRKDSHSIAETWFIVALLTSIAVIAPFTPLIAALGSTETEALSCPARSTHRWFAFLMPILITALVITWSRVFRHLEARATGMQISFLRWGGMAWILALLLLATAPWRLLWNEHPRVLVNGDPRYIVRENGSSLLLYDPEIGVTEHREIQGLSFRRLNTSGYLFEGESAFLQSDQGC